VFLVNSRERSFAAGLNCMLGSDHNFQSYEVGVRTKPHGWVVLRLNLPGSTRSLVTGSY
jgi:hypothetical protein